MRTCFMATNEAFSVLSFSVKHYKFWRNLGILAKKIHVSGLYSFDWSIVKNILVEEGDKRGERGEKMQLRLQRYNGL